MTPDVVAPIIGARRITGGSSSVSGNRTKYKDVKVVQTHIRYRISFKADYKIKGSYAPITNVSRLSITDMGTFFQRG